MLRSRLKQRKLKKTKPRDTLLDEWVVKGPKFKAEALEINPHEALVSRVMPSIDGKLISAAALNVTTVTDSPKKNLLRGESN